MPVAITLPLGGEAQPAVTAMWDRLARAGVSADMQQLGYAPHITLAVLDDDRLDQAKQAASRLAERHEAFALQTICFGAFPGPPAALALLPPVTKPLARLHSVLLDLVGDEAVRAHYRAECWTPHITLAKDLRCAAAALAALAGEKACFACEIGAVEVMTFRPAKIIRRYALRTGAQTGGRIGAQTGAQTAKARPDPSRDPTGTASS